jgi:hypothetical protein
MSLQREPPPGMHHGAVASQDVVTKEPPQPPAHAPAPDPVPDLPTPPPQPQPPPSDALRATFRKLLGKTLKIAETAPLIVEIDAAIAATYDARTADGYKKVIKSRLSNLKQNSELVQRILARDVPPLQFATMRAEDMRTTAMARKDAHAADRHRFDVALGERATTLAALTLVCIACRDEDVSVRNPTDRPIGMTELGAAASAKTPPR